MKDKMYLVYFTNNHYEENIEIFVTSKKSTATKYCAKFNRILKKWKKHYEQYEETRCNMSWLKEGYLHKHYDRWSELRDISNCSWIEIEVR